MTTSLKALIESQAREQENRADHSDDAHFPPPDLAHLTKKYGPYAAGYAEEVEHIDHMLGSAHPKWNSTKRKERSWANLPAEVRDAVKWLINRRHLIMIGAGRDGLVLVDRGGKKPPHAHRVPYSRRARKNSDGAFERCLSLPKLAADTGLRLARVKAIVSTLPDDYRYSVAEYVLEAAAAPDDEVPVVPDSVRDEKIVPASEADGGEE